MVRFWPACVFDLWQRIGSSVPVVLRASQREHGSARSGRWMNVYCRLPWFSDRQSALYRRWRTVCIRAEVTDAAAATVQRI